MWREHRRDRAALLERREAEAADPGSRPMARLSSPVSSISSICVGVSSSGEQLSRLLRGEHLVGELQHLAVDLDQDRRMLADRYTSEAWSFGHQPSTFPCCRSCVPRLPSLLQAGPIARSGRSRSLMLVLVRVCASTRLTMTAQIEAVAPLPGRRR